MDAAARLALDDRRDRQLAAGVLEIVEAAPDCRLQDEVVDTGAASA